MTEIFKPESVSDEWQARFFAAHEGINTLSGYPRQQLESLHPGPERDLEGRLESQRLWEQRVTGGDVPDREFFKSCWVPVHTVPTRWFIDLSDPSLPVFTTYHVQDAPAGWYRIIISPSLDDLIREIDSGITFRDLDEREYRGELVLSTEIAKKRNQLIIDGELPIPPVRPEEVYRFGQPSRKPEMKSEHSLFLYNTLPLAIGLFPTDERVLVISLECSRQPALCAAELRKIRHLRHLIVVMRQLGPENITSFHLDFMNSTISVWFTSGKNLVIIGMNPSERKALLQRHDALTAEWVE